MGTAHILVSAALLITFLGSSSLRESPDGITPSGAYSWLRFSLATRRSLRAVNRRGSTQAEA